MIGSELDAAGVRDPSLREAYRQCRAINARHGKTFFLATRLLAPRQRPAVHALYGFARRADDILDDFDPLAASTSAREQLQRCPRSCSTAWCKATDGGDDPTLAAVVHTARKYDIAWDLFDDFLASMRMDLTVTDYPDRAALERYMYGSAEVIGLQMLPVLGTVGPREEAAPYAAALGKAFQLTNFLRDVDEDLAAAGSTCPPTNSPPTAWTATCWGGVRANRRTDARVRAALAEQHAHHPGRLRHARPGIALLAPPSRPCVAAALTLYSEILDRIEDIDFAIFSQRATVGNPRRLRSPAAGIRPRRGARG